MLVTVSAIVYPLLQNDRDFAQSKGFRAVPENQTLTDVLEQQEAGPVIRERITNRKCDANEHGPRLWLRGPARRGRSSVAFRGESGREARLLIQINDQGAESTLLPASIPNGRTTCLRASTM